MISQSLKVAHVINSLEFGGAEKVLINIVNNDLKSEFKHHVFSLNKNNPLQNELNPEIPFFSFNRLPVFDLLLAGQLYWKFRRNCIDIVHIHGWGIFPESYAAAFLAQVPVKILMDHGMVRVGRERNEKKSLYHQTKKYILSIFTNQTSAFIAVAKEMKKNMVNERGIASDRIHVIHNGIPVHSSMGTCPPTILNKLKKEEHNEENPLILCSVGRLARVKNLKSLLIAFHHVKRKQQNIKLFILGDGPERSNLEEIISRLDLEDDVTLIGFTQNVYSYLINADIFILPSFVEGISIALLEAMSAGLPVIVSDVGGNRELIKHGQNGLLFDPSDRDQLSSHIFTLSCDKNMRETFSANNREKFLQNYSIQKAIKRYHALYRKCLFKQSGSN